MRRTKLAFSIVFMLLSFGAAAQWKVGVSSGYTRSNLITDNAYFYDVKYQSLGGFSVGIPLQYQVQDWLSFQMEMNYTQQNYTTKRSYYYAPLKDATYNSFLEIPLMTEFSFGMEKIRGFVHLGVYGSYWLSSKMKGTYISEEYDYDRVNPGGVDLSDNYLILNYSGEREFNSKADNRFLMGYLMGVGLTYQVMEDLQLGLEGRYYYGVSDLQKNYSRMQTPKYLESFVLKISLMYTFWK